MQAVNSECPQCSLAIHVMIVSLHGPEAWSYRGNRKLM